MLQVRLLGQFDVRAEGQRVLLPSRFGQSLFAFLILNAGTPYRREKLAGLLWPESPEDTARKSLRTELWRIRKALNAHPNLSSNLIAAEELKVWFDPKGDYWLDVRALEQENGDNSTDELAESGMSSSRLMAALKLYIGELLPGFYDDWVLLERERVQAVFERKMALLLDQLVREQQWNAVLEWGERWIALGQTPEPAYRALMIAHGARGDPAQVALVYDRCAEALRNELGVEPSSETRALLQELTHGDTPTRPLLAPLSPVLIQPSGTVTFLFTDIEGSTRLLEDLGDEYAHLLADQRDLLRATAEKHNGHKVDTQGDAFFFAFFRASDAVSFAADAQRALNAHKWPRDTTLRVRMGLHTGEPMLARTGYVGMDVHRAARIGAAGHGGQVLLSQTTRALVENELPPGTHLDDLGEHKLKDLRYPVHIVQLTIEGMPADFPPLKTLGTGSEPPAPGEPPFKGLQFFDEADAGLFFGREAVVGKLVERLQTSPPTPLLQRERSERSFLAVVIGASGSGKSSVVRAGLIPALRATTDDGRRTTNDWRVCVMTPTAHPLEALATVLTRDSESVTATATLLDDLARDARSLQLYLRRMMESQAIPDEGRTKDDSLRHSSFVIGHVLLVVDQFEELFTLCRDEFEREAFIDNLVDALTVSTKDSTGRSQLLTLVITIRADFYAHLAQYPELRDLVAQHQEYIGPMNTEELRRAIEEPAVQGGWEFEPGLVDLILRDVGEEPGALPLLSHALLETWKRRSGRTMTLKGYADAGGVRGAIAHTAESVYQALAPEQQAIARNIFLRLTELGEGTEDTRRRASMDELVPRVEQTDAVRQVVTLLADARLITTSEHGVEVAHEALIREWPQLREWLNQDREGLRLHRQLTEAAQEWELLERDVSALYRGTRLAQARDYAALNPERLNDSERAFMAASEENEKCEEREREVQRQRELLAKEQLLEAEKLRVEQEQMANQRLRRRAVFLASALLLAILLAGIALFLGDRANQNANAAAQSAQHAIHAQATAVSNADAAQKSEASAIKEKRIATARELAANAITNLTVDPERSILLAMQAVKTTSLNDVVLPEAIEALHLALLSSRALYTVSGNQDLVDRVVYSPDGTRLAAVSPDGTIKVWNAEKGDEILKLPIHPQWTSNLSFKSDSASLAAVDIQDDKTRVVRIWDVSNGGSEIRATPLEQSAELGDTYYNAINPDFTHVALGAQDGTVRVWNVQTGKLLETLKGHTDVIWDFTFSPDGKYLATGSNDKTTKIWEIGTGKELLTLPQVHEALLDIAYSGDGTRLATLSNGALKIWDATNGKELLQIPSAEVLDSVAFSNDGTRIAVGKHNGFVNILDVKTGAELFNLAGHSRAVWGVAFSPDDSRLATASSDRTIKVWDLAPSREFLTLAGQHPHNASVAYSPDGTRIATTSSDGTAQIWDSLTGQELLTLAGHTAATQGITFSSDGTRLAIASLDQTATIWDPNSGKLLLRLSGHSNGIRGITFSSDDMRIATASGDGTAKVWDAHTGALQRTLTNPSKDGVEWVSFSPDGARLAMSSGDRTAKVWDLVTGDLLLTLTGHTDSVTELGYSPDGARIVTASRDGTVKIWDSQNGKELLTLVGHTGPVWGMVFNQDGSRIATGSGDKTARVWNAETGKLLQTLPGHTESVIAIAFSPDETKLATASFDGKVYVYLLQIQALMELARTRVSRQFTAEECQKYLHVEECPRE